MRAVFEFLPSVSEELPLFTGDVIEVISVVDEFWLLGSKDGVTGELSGLMLAVNVFLSGLLFLQFDTKSFSFTENLWVTCLSLILLFFSALSF